MRLAAARLAAACVTALPALAADQPEMTPARDVDITYRLAAPDNPGFAEQRVRWDVAGHRQRIDPPTPGLHIIVDTRAHILASVRDAERVAMEIDQSQSQPAEGAAPGHFTRRGVDTVAGLVCTVWQGDGAGSPLLCFTDDGVLLRVTSGGRVVAEAEHVTYAPSNPADFSIPPDYRRVVRQPVAPPHPSAPPSEQKP